MAMLSLKGIHLKDDFEGGISKVGVIVENPEMYKFISGYKNLFISHECTRV